MKRLGAAAAIIAIIIAAALLMAPRPRLFLVLADRDTNREYARFPLEEGGVFAVGFLHSVNKNPVIDVYHIENGEIFVEETVYYSFGAGVQTQLNPGEVMEYDEDGGMIVRNIHRGFQDLGLTYLVGKVSDHTLLLGDVLATYHLLRGEIGVFPPESPRELNGIQVISLGDLCGRGSIVRFTCESRWFG